MAGRKQKSAAKAAKTHTRNAKKKKAAKTPTRNAKKKKAAKTPTRNAETKAVKAAPRSRAAPIRAHPEAGLSKAQVAQLHAKLNEERDRIHGRIRERVGQATQDAAPLPEEGDRAQRLREQDYQLRLADKQQKLLDQVEGALERLESGEYGICPGSGEPIGFPRLEIRPWARYSVDYKEQMDRRKR